MHIALVFLFQGEDRPAAVTELEGAVTDVLLPEAGDTLAHTDLEGHPFRAEVLGRHFDYRMDDGEDVEGSISVEISM